MATLTVYPEPGVTVDGWVQKVDGDWATARSAATGDTSGDSDAATTVIASNLGAGNYTIRRGFFLFNTSSLPDGATITGAVLSFAGVGSGFNNDNSTTLEVVSSSPASDTALSTADFDQVGSTSFGSLAFASYDNTAGAYNDITLNASGLATISKTGITKFGLRTGLDLSNTAPSGGSTVQNRLPTNFSDQTGTDKDPKLVITYTVDTPNFFQLF